jgi:polyprenyldihydroxybenzoate methyltransferase/3-demethylubiquinol 3-O-methyltransferase
MNPVRVQYIREKLVEVAREEQGEGFARDMEQRRDVLRGLDILDVGCGGGLLSEVRFPHLFFGRTANPVQSLARMGARTLGIDASESNIGIASTHANADLELSSRGSSVSAGSLEYRSTSAEELLKDSKQYDVVCSMEVIEHVDNPAGFLSTCAELVKVSRCCILVAANTLTCGHCSQEATYSFPLLRVPPSLISSLSWQRSMSCARFQ